MRDIFYTLIVVWLVFRIWDAFSKKPANKQQQPFSQKKEGEVTIEKINQKKSSSTDDGDYVDFEEMKK